MKVTAARVLVPLAGLVLAPVLLVAGLPIRRRYLRHVYRDGAPPLLEKERGLVSVHWFVANNALIHVLCLPSEYVAGLVTHRDGRARRRGDGRSAG